MKRLLVTSLIAAVSFNVQAQLIITAVYDGPIPGGLPKGVEIYAQENISDLSRYGLGSANNGGGTDGEEFSFPPDSAVAGEFIYVASEDLEFSNFFGFLPNYTSSAMSINGDDAIELFKDGAIIDLFGEASIDGTGQAWEYLDGWAYRNNSSDANPVFTVNDWRFSGSNALDGALDNQSAATPVPIGTYVPDNGGMPPVAELRLISEIQGTPTTQTSNDFGDTDVSPLIGETVIIEGIVVGDFQDNDLDTGRDLRGFFVQEETFDEDGDPLSSEGIFIFDADFGVDVGLGDLVRVRGTVDQFFGETQLDAISDVQVLGNDLLGLVSPALIDLALVTQTSLDQDDNIQPDLEAYEGMLVQFVKQLTITEQFQLDRFNEIKLVEGERPFQFTQQNAPDAALFTQHQLDLGARRITYDDGLNQQNVSINNLDGFAVYNEASAPRMGDSIVGLTGVLDYKWAGNSASGATWRVRSHVDGSNTFTSSAKGDSTNPRPQTAPSISGNLKLASFNVLNFFTTLDDGNTDTAVGLSPRGADDLTRFGIEPATAEFDRQLNKLVNAITELDADVLSLVELENQFDTINDGNTAIEVLVNAVNTSLGDTIYDYVYPGAEFVGTDAIAVGFIYKPAVVNLSENTAPALLTDEVAATLPVFSGRDFSIDPIFNGPATNRVSLAVSFTHTASGEVFTTVANHFKSKGPSGLDDPMNPNFDQLDGAGFWNQRRLDAAIALQAWLETAPTNSATDDIAILGDLNAYAMEAPVQYLLSNGYVNVEDEDAYSFVFDGQLGTLDYVLLSDSLAERFTEAAVWHINADEADALDYNLDFGRDPNYFEGTTATRNSDHDPVIVGLLFKEDMPITIEDLVTAFKNGLADGSLMGTGKAIWMQKLRELKFAWILKSAQRQQELGNTSRVCKLLQISRKASDSKGSDLIKGSALASFNQLIEDVQITAACKN